MTSFSGELTRQTQIRAAESRAAAAREVNRRLASEETDRSAQTTSRYLGGGAVKGGWVSKLELPIISAHADAMLQLAQMRERMLQLEVGGGSVVD